MKLKLYTGVALFLFAVNTSGQTSSKPKPSNDLKVNISAKKAIDIEFPVERTAGNLLVLVTDQKGTTVFLSSENNFKGTYKRKIDLGMAAKGKYDLKVVMDNEMINQKIEIE